MSGETKSQGQKDLLDRFYTPVDVAKKCIELLDLSQFDCIIEPSAGSGNFLQAIEPFKALAFDIAPADEVRNITKADWFLLDKSQFACNKNILVLGNPPFGQQNKLAVNFFNEAAKFCNVIAFILPLSFKKESVQNRLDLNFHLTKEMPLPNCEFFLVNKTKVLVPCVFQIWEKQDKPRKKFKMRTTSKLFQFVDGGLADFRIQRVGGNAGKASFDLTKSASSNYFIKNTSNLSNEEFVNLVNSLEFPSIEFTVGPKSLPKGELVAIIEENIEETEKERL